MEVTQYKLGFDRGEWEEIDALSFDGFDPKQGKPLTRSQWIAVAHMALGKAARIEAGDYGGPEDDDEDDTDWADTLRGIASKILNKFKSGDGQI